MSAPNRRTLLTGAMSLALLGFSSSAFAQMGASTGFDDNRLYKDQFGNVYRKRGGEYVRYEGQVLNGRSVDPEAEPALNAAGADARSQGFGDPQQTPRRDQAGFDPSPSMPDDGPIDFARVYGAVAGEPFPVRPIDWKRFNPAFLRQEVAYTGNEAPGTIVVNPKARHLYLVLPNGRARRYGVGVGKQGFSWSGMATINSKQAWPDWYPPKEMIERKPELKGQVAKLQSGLGVPGGPRNPLGARAMYLWQNNKDTLFRIHGTVEPHTIGQSVSSGCIRMINQDAIDLFNRVGVGTKVVVLT